MTAAATRRHVRPIVVIYGAVVLLLLLPSVAAATSGGQLWAARYDGPLSGKDEAGAVAVSPDGSRVFVTGRSVSTTTGYDYATVAFDTASGAKVWAKRYSSPGNQEDDGAAVAVSPDGTMVFVTGTSAGDVATIAYAAANGDRIWTRRFDGTAHLYDSASSVAISPNGTELFVTGLTDNASGYSSYATVAYDAANGSTLWVSRYGSATGDAAAAAITTSPNGTDVFVTGESARNGVAHDFATVAYAASTGARLWVDRYNGPGNGDDYARDVAVSPDGTVVFVTGGSQGATSDSDFATLAYDASSGAMLWARRYDGPGNFIDSPTSVKVSPDGTTIFVTGYSFGSVSDFDYATLAYDVVTGSRSWLARYNGPGARDDVAYSLGLSPDGATVFVTGYSRGKSNDDYGTVAYDGADGKQLWVARYNGPNNQNDHAYSLAVDPTGARVYVTGTSKVTTGDTDYATVGYTTA